VRERERGQPFRILVTVFAAKRILTHQQPTLRIVFCTPGTTVRPDNLHGPHAVTVIASASRATERIGLGYDPARVVVLELGRALTRQHQHHRHVGVVVLDPVESPSKSVYSTI
jgi:hypothetical protein